MLVELMQSVYLNHHLRPTREAPRFFSFTATSECVSMITDTYILEEFEEHELFMDMETCTLRLIQLDLQRFGLGKAP